MWTIAQSEISHSLVLLPSGNTFTHPTAVAFGVSDIFYIADYHSISYASLTTGDVELMAGSSCEFPRFVMNEMLIMNDISIVTTTTNGTKATNTCYTAAGATITTTTTTATIATATITAATVTTTASTYYYELLRTTT